MMHRVEIPIWQDPDMKPIPGFPPMPKTITKWFRTEEEYKEYMKPTILDSGFNPFKDPLEELITEQKEFIKDNRKYISVGIRFPSLLEELKPTLIEQYKKAAMYE